MREQILEILQGIRPDVDFENEKLLIDDSVLDSFDIISIVGEFNDAFDIDTSSLITSTHSKLWKSL